MTRTFKAGFAVRSVRAAARPDTPAPMMRTSGEEEVEEGAEVEPSFRVFGGGGLATGLKLGLLLSFLRRKESTTCQEPPTRMRAIKMVLNMILPLQRARCTITSRTAKV